MPRPHTSPPMTLADVRELNRRIRATLAELRDGSPADHVQRGGSLLRKQLEIADRAFRKSEQAPGDPEFRDEIVELAVLVVEGETAQRRVFAEGGADWMRSLQNQHVWCERCWKHLCTEPGMRLSWALRDAFATWDLATHASTPPGACLRACRALVAVAEGVWAAELYRVSMTNAARIGARAAYVSGEMAELAASGSPEQEACRAQALRWANVTWEMAEAAQELDLLLATKAAVHANYLKETDDRRPKDELSALFHRTLEWAERVTDPRFERADAALWLVVAESAVEASHALIHTSYDNTAQVAADYCAVAVRWGQRAWPHHHLLVWRAFHITHDVMCCLQQLAALAPDAGERDQLLEEALHWAARARQVALAPGFEEPGLWCDPCLMAIYICASRARYLREDRPSRVALAIAHIAASVLPRSLSSSLTATLTVNERRWECLRLGKQYLGEVSEQQKRSRKLLLWASTHFVERGLAEFATEYLLTGDLEGFSEILDDTMALVTALRGEPTFLLYVAETLSSVLWQERDGLDPALLLQQVEHACNDLQRHATSLGDQDTARRLSLLLSMSAGRLIGKSLWSAGRETTNILEHYDRLLMQLRKDYPSLRDDDFRLHAGSGLFVALREMAEVAWDLYNRGTLAADQVVGRILLIQALNDLCMRIRSRATGAGRPTVPSTDEFVAMARRSAMRFQHTVCVFFDTGWRVLRLLVHPSGLLEIKAFDRAPIEHSYVRFVSLLEQVESGTTAHDLDRRLDEQVSSAAIAVAEPLLGDVDTRRLTLFPCAYLHDALSSTAWHWAERNTRPILLDQAPSFATYDGLDPMPHRPAHRKPTVLVVTAGDIATYRDRVAPMVTSILRKQADVFSYQMTVLRAGASEVYEASCLKHAAGTDGAGALWGGRELEVDLCIWLVHGFFARGWPNVVPDSEYGLAADSENRLLRLGAEQIGHPGGFRLPLVPPETGARCRTGAHGNLDARGVQIRLRRGALVLTGACSSGRVSQVMAEDAAGLLRAFFVAGASAVVAAAWPVLSHHMEAGPTVSEVIWSTLATELLGGGPERTLSSAVLAARQAGAVRGAELAVANRERGRRFIDWGYLTLHGRGDARSPLETVAPNTGR